MRFPEFYASRRRPVISVEVYPPKPESSQEGFRKVISRLVSLRPDFLTVTYGAFGSAQVRTVEIAEMIRREFSIECACHLTCVGATPADIERILGGIRTAGIENIVALRGDPPQGQESFAPPPGGYRHAIDLVGHIRRAGGFGVAVAAYTEKHPEAPDAAADLQRFREKVDAGADIAITQLFYDNRHYWNFVERARALGIGIPIVPGILPILSLGQVKRITGMCGASVPERLLEMLDAAGSDEEAALEVGVRHAVAQAWDLLIHGAPGVHFYVLNKSWHMVRILEGLRPLLAELDSRGGTALPPPPAPAQVPRR